MLVSTPNEQAVSNEPYFKKWGGKITYLKEKLDLLSDSELGKKKKLRIDVAKIMNISAININLSNIVMDVAKIVIYVAKIVMDVAKIMNVSAKIMNVSSRSSLTIFHLKKD